jgi:hypothetical protein
MVGALKRVLNESAVVDPSRPNWLARIKQATMALYHNVASRRWFARFVVLFFVGQLTVQIIHVLVVLVFHKSWLQVLLRKPLESLGSDGTRISAFGVSVICFSALATIFVAIGTLQIKRSLLNAYRNFQRSILVTLLLIQPLMFYRDQWSALIGLAFDILVFLALRFMIEREQLAGSQLTHTQEVIP